MAKAIDLFLTCFMVFAAAGDTQTLLPKHSKHSHRIPLWTHSTCSLHSLKSPGLAIAGENHPELGTVAAQKVHGAFVHNHI